MATSKPTVVTFKWRGYTIDTVENLVDALAGIVIRGIRYEARTFAEKYAEVLGSRKKADNTIGYCLGYLSKDRMVKGLELFNVSHPVFGTAKEAKKLRPKQYVELGEKAVGKASALDGKVIPRKKKAG